MTQKLGADRVALTAESLCRAPIAALRVLSPILTPLPAPAAQELPSLFDVLGHMIYPVLASPGQVIAVTPSHATHAVCAMLPRTGEAWPVVRVGQADYGALRTLLSTGVIVERSEGGTLRLVRAEAEGEPKAVRFHDV